MGAEAKNSEALKTRHARDAVAVSLIGWSPAFAEMTPEQ